MNRMKKTRFFIIASLMIVLMSACSDNDYLNAIPSKSTAVISIDMSRLNGQEQEQNQEHILKTMLHVGDVSKCGLDVKEKVYLFETIDGNLGLCAKVADEGDVSNWLSELSQQRICSTVTERKGFHFAVLKDSWLVGFSSKALLVMGPVVAEAQAEMQRQMVRYLNADEDAGIKSSKLFAQLDSIDSPMAMVAQAVALPEKFVAPFTLGAPKDADASQIVIAAGMDVEDGVLKIAGRTFSFNPSINQALVKSQQVFRPIQGDYVQSMPDDAMAGIFMNVAGSRFLPLVQSNQGLQTLLMGINASIDMDNILRSVDGDMSIVLPTLGADHMQMMMAARLSHAKWLSDVDYWKQSCPKGSTIGNWKSNAFCYSSGKTCFYFGVTDDKQFFSGNDEVSAESSIRPSSHPISKRVQNMIRGEKMVMVINLEKSGGGGSAMQAVTGLLSPLFGQLTAVVYTLK